MKHTFQAGDFALCKGEKVWIRSVNGGWATIHDSRDVMRKVRNGELSPLPVEQEPPDRDRRRLVPADLSRYVVGLGVTRNGNPTLDVDDEAARLLRGLTLDEAYEFVAAKMAEAHAADPKFPTLSADGLRIAYHKLNVGMQRMNLGNRLRRALRAKATAAA